jgi:DNA-binding beta-propeller fold protein YncE
MRPVAVALLAFCVAASAAAAPPRVSQLRVGSAPYRVTASGRTLWAAVNGAGTVVRIDARRGRITGRYRVGGGPGDIAVVQGVVWLGNYVGDSIMRLDPIRRRVRKIRVGRKPIALDVAGGAVWVADFSDGRVTKLSARTGKILLRRSFAESHEGLVVQPEGVWVTSETGVVHKLDPQTGKTLLTVRVGDDADYITAGGGSIWVSCYLDDRLWRLDPATGKALQTITVGTGGQGIAVDGTSVWLAKYDRGRLLRIDAVAGRVVESFRTGPQPRAVALAGGSVWVANSAGSTLTRVRLK